MKTKLLLIITLVFMTLASCTSRDERAQEKQARISEPPLLNQEETYDNVVLEEIEILGLSSSYEETYDIMSPPQYLNIDNLTTILILEAYIEAIIDEDKVIGLRGLDGVYKDKFYVYNEIEYVFELVNLENGTH